MTDLLRQTIATVTAALLAITPSLYAQQTAAAPPTNAATTNNAPPAPRTAVKRAPDGRPVLEEGTPLRLRLTRNLSSADCKTGDQVDFEVLDPVRVGNDEAVAQGAIAWATITDAHAKKSMGRGGKLDLNIDAVKLDDGQKAALRAVKDTKGGGHVGAMTGAMVATSIVFFPAAPLFLFIKGKDTTIPKGTEITAYVNADTPFTPARVAADAPSAGAGASAAGLPVSSSGEAAASTALLDITSTPDGADIEIDGAFTGNTPAKLNLPPGDHTIAVKKSGYQPWERKMHLVPGSVTLKAELQAAPSDQPKAPAAAESSKPFNVEVK
jgi:hypothetical protein